MSENRFRSLHGKSILVNIWFVIIIGVAVNDDSTECWLIPNKSLRIVSARTLQCRVRFSTLIHQTDGADVRQLVSEVSDFKLKFRVIQLSEISVSDCS